MSKVQDCGTNVNQSWIKLSSPWVDGALQQQIKSVVSQDLADMETYLLNFLTSMWLHFSSTANHQNRAHDLLEIFTWISAESRFAHSAPCLLCAATQQLPSTSGEDDKSFSMCFVHNYHKSLKTTVAAVCRWSYGDIISLRFLNLQHNEGSCKWFLLTGQQTIRGSTDLTRSLWNDFLSSDAPSQQILQKAEMHF